MFHSETHPIQINDRFVKADNRNGRVWVVVRVWDTDCGLPHARLTGDNGDGETLIISVSALRDKTLFSPVANA